MRKTKYTVKPTTQFKKDFKLAMKRGLKIELLEEVIAALAMGETLPRKAQRSCADRKLGWTPRVSCPPGLAANLPH